MRNTKYFIVLSILTVFVFVGHAKDFAVINSGAVSDEQLTKALEFCNEQLPFNFVVRNTTTSDCSTVTETVTAATAMKNNEDAAILLLIDCEELQKHQMFDVKTMTAVVNVSGLRSDDAKKYRWRIERMIMRSVATLFGIKAAPDPHCVTRDYHSLDELDKMGRNYTPPYILTVERKAKELGLGVGQ